MGAEHVATNVLADRLKDLEAVGIIAKSRDPDNRRRYIYSLTEKGLDLAPIMLEVLRWSAKFDPNTKVTKKSPTESTVTGTGSSPTYAAA